MNIVLLSGGSGKRLWPLSNEIRSKQFIKIFKSDKNEYESMVQRVYRQIRAVEEEAIVTIATSKSQVSAIHNQLGNQVGVCVEPCRRDTFPAIALAAAWLHDRKGVKEEEAVIVCPVDPYVEETYFKALQRLGDYVTNSPANLVLMGIKPTYPSEKYGYIIPDENNNISRVNTFKEKPDEATAERYIAKGALWNGGVFAFRLGYVLERAHELIDFIDYEDLYSKYETLTKISFDYAVVEKEKAIEVMRFDGQWKDLGTWNTLTEAMDSVNVGEAIFNNNCENVHVINELNLPVLCMGLKNMVISVSPDGILVSDKEQSSYIKPYVDTMTQQIMFAEKSWGSFRVLSIEQESMTIKVTLNPGHGMNYHSHERRDEIWTVISGTGRTVIDGFEQVVSVGDVVTMPAGSRHTIFADTELQVIEVQLGKEISVHDKYKYRLEGQEIIRTRQQHSDLTGIA
ncbi:MAG: mannose-phosphate guanylyltransferase [Lachnospiraceae bacterium]|jgi:mannose-1-phosphate guanylyltransferase|nr:mannose-phosphate guanylyltransferase [Lachnospiraceae bacterium]MDF2843399.1 mannose-phosphate guanylyltransferase [Herbinix sp.]